MALRLRGVIFKRHYYKEGPASHEYEEHKNVLSHITDSDGFNKYIAKHGYHFTDSLAEHASKDMVNISGQAHTWAPPQVKRAMDSAGHALPAHTTTGDVAYLANMYYADFYPDPLKDESSCIKAAYRIANDPDGYEGMPFCRWLMDIAKKKVDIDWEKFM